MLIDTQSSGKVERMNRTLKETLTKLAVETGGKDWVTLLPFVLLRVRNTPGRFGLTSFEILYGEPPPLAGPDGVLDPTLNSHSPSALFVHLKALETVREQIWSQIRAAYSPGTSATPHGIQVGDLVLVRRH